MMKVKLPENERFAFDVIKKYNKGRRFTDVDLKDGVVHMQIKDVIKMLVEVIKTVE